MTPDETPPAAPAAAKPVATRPASAIGTQAGTGPSDDGLAEFTVTTRAGPRVAGRRVEEGETIRLTEDEAAHDLLAGAIVRKGEALPETLRLEDPSKSA